MIVQAPIRYPKIILIMTGVFCVLTGFVCAATNPSPLLESEMLTYQHQARTAQEKGDIVTALQLLEKARTIAPHNPSVLNDMGVLLESTGRVAEAENLYKAALKADSGFLSSYTNLALLYESRKDYVNACQHWMKRMSLGVAGEQWTEIARKRIQDMAQFLASAYENVTVPAAAEEQPAVVAKDIITEIDSVPTAARYLAAAQDAYNKGDYVTALQNATEAEYLDASNSDVSAFMDQLRTALKQ